MVIRISRACTLCHQPFPYTDIWEPLGRCFDACGLDHCLWSTNWTRAVRMGGTLARVYNWTSR